MAYSIGAVGPLPVATAAPATSHAGTRRPRLDPADAALIAGAIGRLHATAGGREVAQFLASSGVEIRVMPDDHFRVRYPGAGAVYEPKTRHITVPRASLRSPSLVTTIAHEGKHAMDFADRPHWAIQGLGLIGGTASDGVRALVTFRNPVTAWLDSLTARQNEDEVNAYEVQARVAHELGRNEWPWSLGQAPDGSPLPVEEIRANVATSDLYRMDPGRRLLLGAGLGFAATSAAALGVQAVAAKVRPGSYLSGHGWPVYALGGAIGAAWLVGDQLRARQLEAYADA